MDVNLIIGALGLIIAIAAYQYTKKTYKKEHIDKPNEDKLHLMTQFKSTQKMSRDAYEVVHKFVVHYDAFDREVWPNQGITYRIFLDEIKKCHENGGNLSDSVFETIKDANLPAMTIQSSVSSLEQQFNSLQLVYQEFRIKTQNLN